MSHQLPMVTVRNCPPVGESRSECGTYVQCWLQIRKAERFTLAAVGVSEPGKQRGRNAGAGEGQGDQQCSSTALRGCQGMLGLRKAPGRFYDGFKVKTVFFTRDLSYVTFNKTSCIEDTRDKLLIKGASIPSMHRSLLINFIAR